MASPPVIIGIDPGTTVGYAVIGMDGSVIEISSSRVLEPDGLIRHLSGIGRAVAVSCDKKKVPSLVESVRISLGARRFVPGHDLLVAEKRELVSGHAIEDDHQRDALASALFCYRSLSGLIRKIRIFIERNSLHDRASDLYCMVIREEVSLKYARDVLLAPEKEEVRIVREALSREVCSKKDIMDIYDRLADKEIEASQLSHLLADARNTVRDLRMERDSAMSRLSRAAAEERQENRLKMKDAAIGMLMKKEASLKKEVKKTRRELKRMSMAVMDIGSYHIAKRVKDLGKGCDCSHIRKGDMVIVDDPSVRSEKVLDWLDDVASAVIFRRVIQSKWNRKCLALDGSRLKTIDFRFFSLIAKHDLDALRKEGGIVEKVVREYRSSRVL